MSLNKTILKQTEKTQFGVQCHALGRFTKASSLAPKCGDLIEIDMEIHYYWAVFVGGGKVVYVQPPTKSNTEGMVRLCDLANLAPSCLMRINNKTVPSRRKKLKPFCPEEIVKNALSCVGRLVPYNILYTNSEHYITEWRFGQSWSDQVSAI